MPLVERSYHQDGYIADGYYETTIEFQGIAFPPNRQHEGFAYLLQVTIVSTPTSIERLSYNHSSSIVGGQFWDPVISSIGNLEKSLSDSSGSIGVQLQTTLGNIIISREQGRNLFLAKKRWADAKFSLFRGPRYGSESLNISNFILIYRGKLKGHVYNESTIELLVEDASNVLDDQPARTLYSETVSGVAEDFFGKPMPVAYGNIAIRPNLLDYATQLHDLHDGRIINILAAYDSLNPYINAGNFDINPSLFNAAPGTFSYSLLQGLVRLGSPPAGLLTVHFHGDYQTGNEALDFNLVRIMLRFLAKYAPSLSFEGGIYLNELLATFSAPGALYLDSEDSRSMAEILSQICTSLGAVWMMTNNDTLRVMRFIFRSPYRTISDQDLLKWQTELPLPPAWKIDVKWGFNYALHREHEIPNPNVPSDLRHAALSEWRVETRFEDAILSERSDARTLTIETFLGTASFGQQLADELFNLHSVEREIVRVTTNDQNFVDEVGLTVHLASDNLDIDKDMVVIRINENISIRQTELTLWG